jgi:hypothetical protein
MRHFALHHLVPASIRRALRDAVWLRQVRGALRELESLPLRQAPSRAALDRLLRAWANDGWAAELEVLEELAHHAATTPGPILECGSGATTVLLAALAARRGVAVWVLEHEPQWAARVIRALGPARAGTLHVCIAPLRNFGAFDWYDAPLSRMPDAFRLVVCDGPPETTRGGRYGVVPMLRDRVPRDAVLILDNAGRPKQIDAMQRWRREAGASFKVHEHKTCQFAIVRFAAASPPRPGRRSSRAAANPVPPPRFDPIPRAPGASPAPPDSSH